MISSSDLTGSVNGNDPMQVGAQFQAMGLSILWAIIKVSLADRDENHRYQTSHLHSWPYRSQRPMNYLFHGLEQINRTILSGSQLAIDTIATVDKSRQYYVNNQNLKISTEQLSH
jgi:hypothetical protein